MSISESKLRRIIREEAHALNEMRAPGYLNPRRPLEKIRDLIDEALMNKSFGFSQRVTDRYIDDLTKMFDEFRYGGQSNPEDGRAGIRGPD